MSRPRVALVVGSGGLKCVSALGLWRVLQRERISIDFFVGCSGGALFTAAMAAGHTFEQTLAASAAWRPELFRRKRKRALLQAVLPSWFGFDETFGILDDRAINRCISDLFGDLTFDRLPAPLHLVASDLRSGEKITLTAGSVWEAVRASIAIPFALPPWKIGSRLLIDGGATDPLPVDVAIREGADIILAMGFENPYFETIGSAAALALQMTSITVNHLLRSTFAFHSLAHHAEVIPIMPQFDRRIGLMDAHLSPYLIAQGEIAAERELPYLKKLLEPAVAS